MTHLQVIITAAPLHIHCAAASGQRVHVLEEDCWCAPVVTSFTARGVFTTVVDHSGDVAPAVRASIDTEVRGLDSFRSVTPIRTGRKLSNWAGVYA